MKRQIVFAVAVFAVLIALSRFGSNVTAPTVEAQAISYQAFNRCTSVTKSDTVDLTLFALNQRLSEGLYVGGTGDVAAVWSDGSTSLFSGVPAGTMLPIGIRRVNSTNTSATLMIACYRF